MEKEVFCYSLAKGMKRGSHVNDTPSKNRMGQSLAGDDRGRPVRLVGNDPLYEVLPVHLELLTARGFTYEVVPARPRRPEKRRHGTAD